MKTLQDTTGNLVIEGVVRELRAQGIPTPHPVIGLDDPALRQQLLDLRNQAGWSTAKLATKLGVSSSVISQYLNLDENGALRPEGSKYPGDIATLEKRIQDLLRNEARRQASGVETTECEVSRELRTALEYIRKTNDVGIVLGEAGQGKSRGIELFMQQNPLAVLYQVRSWTRDIGSIEAGLFEVVGRSGYDHRTKRSIFITSKLRGSDRLLIVDDAHKLTRPALQYLFDLYDETHCPIGLVGTYELEDLLKDDAQRFSRTGLRWELTPEDPTVLIKHMILNLCGEVGNDLPELIELCHQVATKHGHFRSVHKQLKLAAELKSDKDTWPTAFRLAHTNLIREYKLG
jgi:DNA transposition AAA+ family ATPase